MRLKNLAPIALFALLAVMPSESQGQDAPAAKYRYWTSNWSFQSIDLKELTRKIGVFGIGIPVELAGQASIDFNVSVPLNALRTPEAYKFHGTLVSTNLQVDDVFFKSLRAQVDYAGGILSLEEMRGEQPGGSFVADANAELVPRGDFQATIEATEFDVGPFAKLFQKFELVAIDRPIQGAVSFSGSARGRVDQLGKPQAWTMSGKAGISDASVGNSLRYSVQVEKFHLENRRLSIPKLRMSARELPEFYLDGSADLSFDAGEPFQLSIHSNDLPATDLVGLYVESPQRLVDGKLDLRATATGFVDGPEGKPALDVTMLVASPSLRLFGVEVGLIEHLITITPNRVEFEPRASDASINASTMQLQRASADYQVTDQAIDLRRLEAELFGGRLTANGTLARNNDGRHELDAQWTNVAPRFRIMDLPKSEHLFAAVDTSGSIRWSVPRDGIGDPSRHEGVMSIQANAIRIRDEVIGSGEIEVNVADQQLDVTADATLFDGKVRIQAATLLRPDMSWREVPAMLFPLEMTVADVSLRKVGSLVSGGESRFDGRLNGRIHAARRPDGQVSTMSNLSLRSWTSANRLLASELGADLTTRGLDIEITSVSGNYAGGQLQAEGTWSIGSGPKLINFRFTRADAARALLPISPRADQWFGGLVSGRGTAVGQRNEVGEVRVSGSLSVERGTTFGFPVGDAHSSFNGQFSASPYSWKASFPAISAALARGRMRGNLEFASSSASRSGFHMESGWRMNHVDFESLLDTYVGTSTIGRGDLTGDFSLSGRDISGIRDLTGDYQVRLGGTDATAVPGLSAAGSLLGAPSLVGVRFNNGESSGRIHRGSLFIDSMTMSADQVSVTAMGRVDLQNRQMDVLTTLSTGNFQGQNQLLGTSVSQVVLNQVPLSQINRVASNRTLVFKLVGPTRDPILRFLPAETLQANARRLVVQETISLILSDSVWDD